MHSGQQYNLVATFSFSFSCMIASTIASGMQSSWSHMPQAHCIQSLPLPSSTSKLYMLEHIGHRIIFSCILLLCLLRLMFHSFFRLGGCLFFFFSLLFSAAISSLSRLFLSLSNLFCFFPPPSFSFLLPFLPTSLYILHW